LPSKTILASSAPASPIVNVGVVPPRVKLAFAVIKPAAVIAPVVVIVSMKASLKRTPVVPKSTSLSVCGPNTPSDTNTCSALAA